MSLEILNQFSERAVGFERVAERRVQVHFVVISTSVACLDDDPVGLEFTQDTEYRALCDAYFDGEFAHANVWLS